MEPGGAVAEVMQNAATRDYAAAICKARGVLPYVGAVYRALLTDDVLGIVFARLNLLPDPEPLPAAGDQDGMWQCYLRVWRPGVPRPDDWPGSYAWAMEHTQP